jgi:hypothetical protein
LPARGPGRDGTAAGLDLPGITSGARVGSDEEYGARGVADHIACGGPVESPGCRRAVAAQAAILVAEAARSAEAVSSVINGSGDRAAASDGFRTYTMMLLVAAPVA